LTIINDLQAIMPSKFESKNQAYVKISCRIVALKFQLLCYRSAHAEQTSVVPRRSVGARRAGSFSADAAHGQAYSERFGAVRMPE